MSYTVYSPIAQETMAYKAGYISGFNQLDADTRTYRAGESLWDKYYEGRRDGIADMLATTTRTGVK